MLRRFLSLIFAAAPLLLPPCAWARLSVLTTVFPPYDFARAVAGERADVSMLLPPGAEAHDFEPTPRDIIKIQGCSLFIYTGGENDVWIEKMLSSFGEKRPKTLRMMDCVPLLDEEEPEGGSAGHHHGHDEDDAHGGGHAISEHGHGKDEHVWTSVENSMMIVASIADALSELDSGGAEYFAANAEAYNAGLAALKDDFASVVSSSARRHVLFADRFPFVYFAHELGLTYDAAFSGCSTETEPSAATVVRLVRRVEELALPAVFTMELTSTKMADSICEVTGAERLLLNSGHNLTRGQFEGGMTYTDILRENLEALKAALN